ARLRGAMHTRLRDRSAIAHHYDLSNEFYALLLDEHLAYSAGYFESPSTASDQSLHDAQTAKLDLICAKLGLREGMRLLDVGCGWGSLILHAAQHYGVHATGITLSEQQRGFIAVRASERGLSDAIDVRLQDYREFGELPGIAGTFDAVSSIEMGEHVGEAHYPEYVAVMFEALKPRGRLLLQQMSRSVDAAPGGGAFIERYIAPDMHMRPLWQTLRHLQLEGFEIRGVEAMREHYVRTVDAWIETFETHHEQFVDLVGEEVVRAWRLYLVGGRLAFAEGRMGVDQVLAAKTTGVGVSGF
ncbi:MAG: cyclopropane-fatty-acyl-phospholipid synthase family protein, partial [Mycobacterium sp.]